MTSEGISTVEHQINTSGSTCKVAMSGRFTFTDNDRFREIINNLQDSGATSCVFDLSGLEFMDSAGLGMLLLAHETAGQKNIDLRLRGPQGEVRRILEVSKFSEIIPIDD